MAVMTVDQSQAVEACCAAQIKMKSAFHDVGLADNDRKAVLDEALVHVMGGSFVGDKKGTCPACWGFFMNYLKHGRKQ